MHSIKNEIDRIVYLDTKNDVNNNHNNGNNPNPNSTSYSQGNRNNNPFSSNSFSGGHGCTFNAADGMNEEEDSDHHMNDESAEELEATKKELEEKKNDI